MLLARATRSSAAPQTAASSRPWPRRRLAVDAGARATGQAERVDISRGLNEHDGG